MPLTKAEPTKAPPARKAIQGIQSLPSTGPTKISVVRHPTAGRGHAFTLQLGPRGVRLISLKGYKDHEGAYKAAERMSQSLVLNTAALKIASHIAYSREPFSRRPSRWEFTLFTGPRCGGVRSCTNYSSDSLAFDAGRRLTMKIRSLNSQLSK